MRISHPFLSLFALPLLIGCSTREQPLADPGTEDSPNVQQTAHTANAAEQLFSIPPRGWSLSAASNTERFRRARYLRDPSAEHLESLTFEYLDPSGQPDPIEFLESMAAEQNERCDSFSSVPVNSQLDNGYPSAVRLLRCPRRKVNGLATVSLAKAIAGQEGYYLIVFEKTADAQMGAEGWVTDHVTEADVARWSLYLRRATVCDPREPDHPCPDR